MTQTGLTALEERASRIKQLFAWARTQKLKGESEEDVFRIRKQAMVQFYVSGRKASEYAQVVAAQLGSKTA